MPVEKLSCSITLRIDTTFSPPTGRRRIDLQDHACDQPWDTRSGSDYVRPGIHGIGVGLHLPYVRHVGGCMGHGYLNYAKLRTLPAVTQRMPPKPGGESPRRCSFHQIRFAGEISTRVAETIRGAS